MEKTEATPGLGNQPQNEWPKATDAELLEKPIKRLKPGSPHHARLLQYLLERLDLSEREMSKFYPRWQVNEKKIQAYVDLEDWERKLKELNQKGEKPKVVSIIVPYAYATISTIVTYLIHGMAGRKPILQVGSFKKETMKNAQMMEMVLQYQADRTRLIRHLYQFFMDGETYGVGILRTRWRTEKALRTVWKKEQNWGWLDIFLGSKPVRKREMRTVFEGNEVYAQDPYMFFPDPRVPMCDVNKRGEFVFWRTFEGKHFLKEEEAQGRISWVDAIGTMPVNNTTNNSSARAILAGGSPTPGFQERASEYYGKSYYQIDQGSITIIPAELGLGSSTRPEKWMFSIANKSQIIQAEPYDADHGMHPVAVAEPNGVGYGFGQLGTVDYLAPMQDTLSWLINSHMDNVKTVLNNMLIVDPSMVELQDLKNPQGGLLVRTKAAAYGRDINSFVKQLQTFDVTQGHIRDFELFMRMGDSLSSVTDNLRGLQDSGGRKTATEIRTSGEAGASRLAAKLRLVSSQAFVDLAQQMSLNTQQHMTEEFFITLAGMEGAQSPLHIPEEGLAISPEMLAGDFNFPIHDGTLPLDRVAMLDVWKEIFLAIAQDQQLRSSFNVPAIFEYIAELGGAKNLDKFKLNVQPMAPGMEPPPGAMPIPQGGSPAAGIAPNPGARLGGQL